MQGFFPFLKALWSTRTDRKTRGKMQQCGKCKIRVWTGLAFNGYKSEWGLGKGFQATRCFLKVRKRYLDLKKKKKKSLEENFRNSNNIF